MAKRDLGTTEVARICGVSNRSVAMWVDKGILTGYCLPENDQGNRERRVTREELRKFMKKYSFPLQPLLDCDLISILMIGTNRELFEMLEKSFRTIPQIQLSRPESVLEAGIHIPTRKWDICIVDFSIGRETALMVKDLFLGAGAESPILIGIANEDESNLDYLSVKGYTKAMKKPLSWLTVASEIGGFIKEHFAIG